MRMKITPYILGSGKAAAAIIESLRILETSGDVELGPLKKIKRGDPLKPQHEDAVLFIANPHALHAPAILEAEKYGFKLVICEKPAAISLKQIDELKNVKIPVALCFVYQQMWGIQKLKKLIAEGEFGEIVTIEGRYWQSSTAKRSLTKENTGSWKIDPNLSGNFDVLLDITSHWADAAIFLLGEFPAQTNLWLSHANAEARHRDSHNHLQMSFPSGARAMASTSKIVHGAPNQFEISIIGTKKYGCWKFLEPDIIEISQGSTRSFITRDEMSSGSQHWPHHGLGWIEGYIEIIRRALQGGEYPSLSENLKLMRILFDAASCNR